MCSGRRYLSMVALWSGLIGLLSMGPAALQAQEENAEEDFARQQASVWNQVFPEMALHLSQLPEGETEEQYLQFTCEQASKLERPVERMREISKMLRECYAAGSGAACQAQIPAYIQERQRLPAVWLRPQAIVTVLQFKYQGTPAWLRDAFSTPPCGLLPHNLSLGGSR